MAAVDEHSRYTWHGVDYAVYTKQMESGEFIVEEVDISGLGVFEHPVEYPAASLDLALQAGQMFAQAVIDR